MQVNLMEILVEVYSSLEPKFDECVSSASDQIISQGSGAMGGQGEMEKYLKEKAFLNFLCTLKKEFNIHVHDIHNNAVHICPISPEYKAMRQRVR